MEASRETHCYITFKIKIVTTEENSTLIMDSFPHSTLGKLPPIKERIQHTAEGLQTFHAHSDVLVNTLFRGLKEKRGYKMTGDFLKIEF